MNGKVLCIFEERICVATLLGALFFFAHSADAAVVQVHVSGNVSSVLERGLAIGTTGVSPGDTFNMVFEYDLDQGEFLSWPDSIRQSYAEPIVAGPYPGMSAELSIGSLIWSLQSEEMTTEAHVMLDQRESIGSQLFNLRLRTQSE